MRSQECCREKQATPVRDNSGETITGEDEQRVRWTEHFKEILNRPPPPAPPDMPPATELLEVNTSPPTKQETMKAIKYLKSGKTARQDGIPLEALRADVQTSTDMLHPLLVKIWETETVPEDWKKGLLVKPPKKGDLSQCNNWRGIMLGKVLSRIILERLNTTLDKTLRDEQAGLRQDRSCTDHIATMRIVIEQSLEWQSPCTVSSWISRRHLKLWTGKSSGGLCSTTAFPPSTSPSSSSCMKMPPAKSYTRESWPTPSRYRPVYVRAAYCRRQYFCWWWIGLCGSPQKARSPASSRHSPDN